MSEPPKKSSRLRPKVVVNPSEAAPNTLGPDEETLVPCPVCRRGMVPPAVAAKIAELLRCEHDGPDEGEGTGG